MAHPPELRRQIMSPSEESSTTSSPTPSTTVTLTEVLKMEFVLQIIFVIVCGSYLYFVFIRWNHPVVVRIRIKINPFDWY